MILVVCCLRLPLTPLCASGLDLYIANGCPLPICVQVDTIELGSMEQGRSTSACTAATFCLRSPLLLLVLHKLSWALAHG
jgi:hypothetical protein